ncbi:SDR family NAD(P)-dependent oxidoreductase [Kineococcus terrestris]|uniref:SDR family NAD(P)-dependent oxidoreductase n=1 Tax=Kineococcus terrestris TaxID=2044856 RepID=UPI0034DB11B7
MDLTGQVALVTGAGGGLGAAISRELASAGATVWVSDVRAEGAERTAADVAAAGGTAHALPLDVGDAAAVALAVAQVVERSGPVDVLVNNAGYDVCTPIEHQTAQQAADVVAANLLGPMYLVAATYPSMLERNHGYVVNTLSTAARRVWTEASAYAASKHGLRAYTAALFKEAQRDCRQRHGSIGVGVTGLIPGGMATRFVTDRFPDADLSKLQDPATVARALMTVFATWPDSVVPELAVLPPGETSW